MTYGMFRFENSISAVIFFIILALKLFAFVTSLTYSAEAYRAADKWTKPGWTTVLGAAVLLQFVLVSIPFVSIGFLIAALVYLADVRPALSGLRRR